MPPIRHLDVRPAWGAEGPFVGAKDGSTSPSPSTVAAARQGSEAVA